jgi:transposase
MARKISDEKELSVVSMYELGSDTETIAEIFGVSAVTIRTILYRQGVKIKGGVVPFDVEDEIVELYQSGLSYRQTAKKVGFSQHAVLKVLRRKEIKPRHEASRSLLSKDQHLEVVDLYKNGLTGDEIADKYNVGRGVIYYCLRKYNVKTRTGWGRFKTEKWVDKKDRVFVFKSDWELKYANYLDEQELDWEYEPTKFILKECRFYTPDFQVVNYYGEVEYHEVKGWLDEATTSRLFEFVREYPKIVLRIIGPDEMVKLGLVEEYYSNHHMAEKVINLRKKLKVETVVA